MIGTVQLLADHGYWQFGVVVLVAGVAIPIVVLVGLIWLLVARALPERPAWCGGRACIACCAVSSRWPMIIPFIAAIAAPIVDFRGIDDIVAGPGATPLFMLVALLMLAMRLFEPRLMWKTAGEAAMSEYDDVDERRHEEPGEPRGARALAKWSPWIWIVPVVAIFFVG